MPPDTHPFDPDLRIPPLQDPRPAQHAHRPPALEPNARVHAPPPHHHHRHPPHQHHRQTPHRQTPQHHPQLTTRAKALQEAKALDETAAAAADDDGFREARMRKKQKVDVFQLPHPEAPTRAPQPPPFEPVRVLHELHEPPPSAGLFPPITPSGVLGSGDVEPATAELAVELDAAKTPTPTAAARPSPNKATAKEDAKSSSTGEVKPKAKRKCLRGRLKWTDGETQDLLKGVGVYGVGKWKKILNDPAYSFHPDRTMVDLKDRYRTCRMNDEKAIERHAAVEGPSTAGSTASRSSSPPIVQSASLASDEALGSGAGTGASATVPAAEPQFNITTATSYEESLTSPKMRKLGGAAPWTDEEDGNLSRGYQKYGFQWTAIAKDPAFKLGHRTGAQVRDRFRMRYPVVYQSSVPLPLPEADARQAPKPKNRAPRNGGSSRRGNNAEPSSDPTQLTFIIHNSSTPPPNSYSAAAAATRRSRPPLPAILAPSEQSVPSLSSQGSSPGTPAVMLPDRFSGLNVQPLPDAEPDFDSRGPLYSPPSSPSDADGDRDVDTDDPVPTTDPDEFRHLSIFGLLNEDNDDDNDRLPSFHEKFVGLGDFDRPITGPSDSAAAAATSTTSGAGITLPRMWDDIGMQGNRLFDL